jgi:hypothetical protein
MTAPSMSGGYACHNVSTGNTISNLQNPCCGLGHSYLPPEAAALNTALRPGELPNLTAEQLTAAREAYSRLSPPGRPDVRELIDHHLTKWRTALSETAKLESEV